MIAKTPEAQFKFTPEEIERLSEDPLSALLEDLHDGALTRRFALELPRIVREVVRTSGKGELSVHFKLGVPKQPDGTVIISGTVKTKVPTYEWVPDRFDVDDKAQLSLIEHGIEPEADDK